MDSNSNNQQDVTADECKKAVEEVVSLISASGSIAGGLINAYVARGAIYMAYLTWCDRCCRPRALSVQSYGHWQYHVIHRGNAVLFAAKIVIRVITQKFKDVVKEASTNYLGKAKGSLFIIEGLLNNRIEILKSYLNECSGRLCDDIRELIEYYSGSAISGRAERQS